MHHLNDGVAIYRTSDGTDIPGVEYMIERNLELYDEQGVAERVTAITIRSSAVKDSRYGDQIITGNRTWTVYQTLEDDDQLRRMRVS